MIASAQLANRYTEASRFRVRQWAWYEELVRELAVLTRAWNHARRQALQGLRVRAEQVGAAVSRPRAPRPDGVADTPSAVGVR